MRLVVVVSVLLALLTVVGCSNNSYRSQTAAETTSSSGIAPGYSGGCQEGFTIYSQNQFTPYGTMVRRTLSGSTAAVGLYGNDSLQAIGWRRGETVAYPDNPPGLRGEVWFYVQLPDGSFAWAPDAGVRATMTYPALNDEDDFFDATTQAAPQPSKCELSPR